MSVVFSQGQSSVALALNLTDDDYALEALETYQLLLIIPQTSLGSVAPGDPTTTTINIQDDDGMWQSSSGQACFIDTQRLYTFGCGCMIMCDIKVKS